MGEVTELREQLRSITSVLQRLAECSICLEKLRNPFKLCSRGHMMCNACIASLSACPSCEGEFSIENPSGIKNILEALPKFCCYSTNGCKAVVVDGDDHETFCGYRLEACRVCFVMVDICHLLEHYETCHSEVYIVQKCNDSITWPDVDPYVKGVDVMLIDVFGQLFWLTVINDIDEKQFKVKFQLVPIGKPVDDYYIRVEFKNVKHEFSYVYTLKAYLEDDQKDDGGTQFCMRIPQAALNRFINENNELDCDFILFKEPNSN